MLSLFSVHHFRITASNFGAVLSRRPSTPPDSLVLRIIWPRNIMMPAIKHVSGNKEIHSLSAE